MVTTGTIVSSWSVSHEHHSYAAQLTLRRWLRNRYKGRKQCLAAWGLRGIQGHGTEGASGNIAEIHSYMYSDIDIYQ